MTSEQARSLDKGTTVYITNTFEVGILKVEVIKIEQNLGIPELVLGKDGWGTKQFAESVYLTYEEAKEALIADIKEDIEELQKRLTLALNL